MLNIDTDGSRDENLEKRHHTGRDMVSMPPRQELVMQVTAMLLLEDDDDNKEQTFLE